MTNAELIKALRCCARVGGCTACPRNNRTSGCWAGVTNDAADVLEAYENRIAELSLDNKMLKNTIDADKGVMLDRIRFLEAQLPKEGECEAKRPKTVKKTGYSFYCDCPTCGGRLISNVDGEWCAGSFDRFCRMCGQKIDWSEYCGRSNMPRAARMRTATDCHTLEEGER